MSDRSYIGIDYNDRHEWVVAIVCRGKGGLLRKFKNTREELIALVSFIDKYCVRPKICINPSNRAALKLLKLIGELPDLEVVLISQAGIKMHSAWLKLPIEATDQNESSHAVMLARCAARMI
jgi:hypothetical protein